MQRIMLGILLLVSIIAMSCSSNKSIPVNTAAYTDILYAAWNGDTTSSYLLYICKNNKFRYDVSKTDSNNRVTKHCYSGTYKATRNDIYLLYNNNHFPPGVTNYLTIETSGNYFIQYFTNDSKRVFLQIENLRHYPL